MVWLALEVGAHILVRWKRRLVNAVCVCISEKTTAGMREEGNLAARLEAAVECGKTQTNTHIRKLSLNEAQLLMLPEPAANPDYMGPRTKRQTRLVLLTSVGEARRVKTGLDYEAHSNENSSLPTCFGFLKYQVLLPVHAIRICTDYANELGTRKFRGNVDEDAGSSLPVSVAAARTQGTRFSDHVFAVEDGVIAARLRTFPPDRSVRQGRLRKGWISLRFVGVRLGCIPPRYTAVEYLVSDLNGISSSYSVNLAGGTCLFLATTSAVDFAALTLILHFESQDSNLFRYRCNANDA
uniref:Uncharacterized protein n=1 Tax=Timema douglasi TaxID=61478 RepID=A0A7R8VBW9_TIMDO|nr:unnamed protein product [Timema douglasi]